MRCVVAIAADVQVDRSHPTVVGSHVTRNLGYHGRGLPEIGLAYPACLDAKPPTRDLCVTRLAGLGEGPHRRRAAGAVFDAVLTG